MDSDQGEFDDFATPACKEAMNAAELQSGWKIDTPVWDEAPSTSSGQRELASPEKHVETAISSTNTAPTILFIAKISAPP
ncbi:hypothetical protein AVEN_63606-1 [Araneus ventricosus]|uniref:Uncharacterized protein n=1 Tax=Araneus ventricosus TaxID=182803 RepID=A0A4Y2SPG6_ARAVE|nr:hypothetical protein AVEN_63606-1 [Araneus ventricosus]